MKKLILLFSLFCYLESNSQVVSDGIHMSDFKIIKQYELWVSDSIGRLVAYKVKDSGIVVIDTMATIEALSVQVLRNMDEMRLGYAAMDILNYITLKGTIVNRKKFDYAVKEFIKLKNKTK